MEEREVLGLNGRSGVLSDRMYIGEHEKIIPSRIYPDGVAIGNHRHDASDDLNYILSGEEKAIYDGEEELLLEGICHVCGGARYY